MRFPRAAVAAAAAMLIPVFAAAQEQPPQGPPPGGGQGRGRMAGAGGGRIGGPMMGQRMNGPQLTEQQRERIRTFDEQQRQTLEATRRELGDLHRQLNEQLTAEKPDSSKINALRASIVQKETALAQARVDRLAKLSSILTAEQRQSLRGRGLGEVFGAGGRGIEQRRPGRDQKFEMRGRLRGGAHGFRGRGTGAAGSGFGIRERARSMAADARLRAEIRRLEAQLNALRRRIR